MRNENHSASWSAACVLLATMVWCLSGRGEAPDQATSRPAAAPAAGTRPARPATAPSAQANPLAGCVQCHVDVERKYVKSLHFQRKIACTSCHGPSKGHLADENNEVKPDVVFARNDVDSRCERCHDCPRPAEARANERKPLDKVCTDCHGSHTLVRK
ncbi:MAG: hypothetical protein ABSH20_11110 [Tepidisphaeraceae bacterium]